MTNYQIAKQKVIRAALATLLEKKALWENLTGMVKDVDALAAVKAALEAESEAQAVTSHGATAAQQAKRDALRRKVRCAGRLLAHYAEQTGDIELAGSAQVKDRVLAQGTLGEVLAEARRVETLVKAHPAAFEGSFTTPDFLKTVSDAVAAFEAVMGKPRIVIVTRAAATDQVEKLVRLGQRLLVALDVRVEQFEDDDPAFVTTWKHALKGRAPQWQTETTPEVATLAPAPEVKAA